MCDVLLTKLCFIFNFSFLYLIYFLLISFSHNLLSTSFFCRFSLISVNKYVWPSPLYFLLSIDVSPAFFVSHCANDPRVLFLIYFQIALEINEINFWKNKKEKSK